MERILDIFDRPDLFSTFGLLVISMEKSLKVLNKSNSFGTQIQQANKVKFRLKRKKI